MSDHDSFAFVRENMVPAEEPPVSQVGLVRWVRENLFPSWFGSILTLIAAYVIYSVLSAVLPWFLHSVWNATSLGNCREIMTETWGEGNTGACFAVIRARWHQFLFGFYPQHLYWRPILTFVLLFAALAPVLFTQIPRKLLWLSIIYPGVGYWLLWGGPLTGPIVAYAGFAIWAAVIVALGRYGSVVSMLAGALAAVIWWIALAGPVGGFLGANIPLATLEPVSSKQFGGFTLSFVIGITGIACSLPLGILLALGRQSNLFFIKTICVVFIEFIRGVPLITLLLVASFLLNVFMPPGTNFDIILRVCIMVTMFSAAYIAEVIRGGLAAIPRGQYEAGDALGLTYWQKTRLITMPQALKISIPGIVNTFIGLFKDTTLVSIIALLDPLGFIQAIRADSDWNGIIYEMYGFIALIFFLFCFGMSQYSQYLERKLRTDHR